MQYLNFDLKIERMAQGYSVEVSCPAGQAAAPFNPPFSELELENFLLRIGQSRRVVRRVDSPEVEAAKAFGARLFDAVFSGEPRACLRSSLDMAASQDQGLRIRLLLTEVPELVDLPWEYLYNPSLNRFLTLSAKTPIVRYLELPERIRPLKVAPPLHVLVLISSPQNYPPLDTEREWSRLRTALEALERRGLIVLERLDRATLAALQQRLRRGKYNILHFIGHGGFDEQRQDGVLLLEDEQRYGHRVSGQDLGTLVYDHDPLRLAILSACEGGRSSRSDPFAGVAQSLVQQGTPAVIAMQFEVTDEAAITLAQGFYGALADGYPVDAALAEARRGVFAESAGVEWGTPVLYMRAEDGCIFDIPRALEGQPTVQVESDRLRQLWRQALAASSNEDWERAEQLLADIAERAPDYEDVQARLTEARRQRQIQALQRRVEQHREVSQWQGVLDALDELKRLDPDYPDTDQLRRWAEERRRHDQQYAAALIARERGDWAAAVATLEALLTTFPEDEDAQALLQSVHAERQAAAPPTARLRRPWPIPVISSIVVLFFWAVTLIAIVESGATLFDPSEPKATLPPARPSPRFRMLPIAGSPQIVQFYGATRWAASMGGGLYEGSQGLHPGIDFTAPAGTPVLAIDHGVVLCTGPTCLFGGVNPIVVRYGDVYAVYSRVADAQVARGKVVQPGMLLGRTDGLLMFQVLPAPEGGPSALDPNQPLISLGVAVNPLDYFTDDMAPYFDQQFSNVGGDDHFCHRSLRDQPPILFGGPASVRPCKRT